MKIIKGIKKRGMDGKEGGVGWWRGNEVGKKEEVRRDGLGRGCGSPTCLSDGDPGLDPQHLARKLSGCV